MILRWLFTLALSLAVHANAEATSVLSNGQCAPFDPGPIQGPPRTTIKGITTDDGTIDSLVGNGLGHEQGTFFWAAYEIWSPTQWHPDASGVCPVVVPGTTYNIVANGGCSVAYEDACYLIDLKLEAQVQTLVANGVHINGKIYGTPPGWALPGNCPLTGGLSVFCASTNSTDIGRFAGMLASRYNGYIDTFSLGNEVNNSGWYNTGCTKKTCDPGAWIQRYANDFNAVNAEITKNQPKAVLMTSFTQAFLAGSPNDNLNQTTPNLSVQTFLNGGKIGKETFKGFSSLVAPGSWRIGFHPYPPFSPPYNRQISSADDLTYGGVVTTGNIGVLSAWLQQTYPSQPQLWQDLSLTESGFTSSSPTSGETVQNTSLCSAFQSILGTPGINEYLYQRGIDFNEGGSFGLWTSTPTNAAPTPNTPKTVWPTWALADRFGVGAMNCGFQYLPYIQISQGSNPKGTLHRTSSRTLPTGFTTVATANHWLALRDANRPGTHLVYECTASKDSIGKTTYLSQDVACGGKELSLGPVGYFFDQAPSDAPSPWVHLYNCKTKAGDNVLSISTACTGTRTDIGYAMQENSTQNVSMYTPLKRGNNPGAGHWVTAQILPPGYQLEEAWYVLRDPQPGSHLFYECSVGPNSFPSQDPGCEGQVKLGTLGYFPQTQTTANQVMLNRCSTPGGDHFVSTSPNCEGFNLELPLGYVNTSN